MEKIEGEDPGYTQYIYPVTGYRITILKDGLGWIQLLDGDIPAGYIYLNDDRNEEDRFGGIDSKRRPYMVTHYPTQLWNIVLDILRSEKNITIRGFQADANNPVRVFLEVDPNLTPVEDGENPLEQITKLRALKEKQ